MNGKIFAEELQDFSSWHEEASEPAILPKSEPVVEPVETEPAQPKSVQIGSAELWRGDSLEILATFEENSIDAIVTDPPYGLEFMGKDWDSFRESGSPWAQKWNTGKDWKGHERTRPGRLTARLRHQTCERCGRQSHQHDGAACSEPSWTWIMHAPVQLRAYQSWSERWAVEALRVLKPGGHLLVFGGTRTFHRLTCAIEDAGFEIRDCLTWLYGQGFPKSLDVSKAIDKAAGVEREVVGLNPNGRMVEPLRFGGDNARPNLAGHPPGLTEPVTDDARRWKGWGTALKPAWEPIVLARKPLSERNVAANVLEYGTGALNIDGSRILGSVVEERGEAWAKSGVGKSGAWHGTEYVETKTAGERTSPLGRWPANVALSHSQNCKEVGSREVKGYVINRWTDGAKPFGDGAGHPYETSVKNEKETISVWECVEDCPVRFLDEQSGITKSGAMKREVPGYEGESVTPFIRGRSGPLNQRADIGGASRFFYTAKAAPKERNRGLPEGVKNSHPTVKPLRLMDWLIRLITPPEGRVLDLFMGSGTTGVAAVEGGWKFIGIEKDVEPFEIAEHRIRYAVDQTPV